MEDKRTKKQLIYEIESVLNRNDELINENKGLKEELENIKKIVDHLMRD